MHSGLNYLICNIENCHAESPKTIIISSKLNDRLIQETVQMKTIICFFKGLVVQQVVVWLVLFEFSFH